MSTEATGDGQTDAGGAVEPEAAAEDAGTSATAVAEATVTGPGVTGAGVTEPATTARPAWDPAPSAWGTPESAEPDADQTAPLVPSQAAAVDEAATAGGPVPDQAPALAGAVADEAAPSGTSTSEAAPGEAAPGEAAPAETAPGGTSTSEAAHGEVTLAEAAPGEGEAPVAGGLPAADAAPASGETALKASEAPETDESPQTAGAVAAQEAAPAGGSGQDAGTSEPTGAGEPAQPAESGEFDEPGDLSVDAGLYDSASDEAGELDEGYDDYADGEAAEYAEYDESYQEDVEPGEAAARPRARRWPRVLLALGFVVLAAVIVGGAVAIVGSVTHGFKKPVKVTYTKSALFNLKTGECFDPRGQSYSLVSCDSPHVAEVFATFKLSGSKWPGATAVAAGASRGCATRLTSYLNPQLAISLSSTYVYPDPVAWQAGTRTVICEVRATSGDLTGSVRGASATAG